MGILWLILIDLMTYDAIQIHQINERERFLLNLLIQLSFSEICVLEYSIDLIGLFHWASFKETQIPISLVLHFPNVS